MGTASPWRQTIIKAFFDHQLLDLAPPMLAGLAALLPVVFSSFHLPLPSTPSPPLQVVVAAEQRRGGRLLEEPKLLPFRASSCSLQVTVEELPQLLWSLQPCSTCQVTR